MMRVEMCFNSLLDVSSTTEARPQIADESSYIPVYHTQYILIFPS